MEEGAPGSHEVARSQKKRNQREEQGKGVRVEAGKGESGGGRTETQEKRAGTIYREGQGENRKAF